MRHSTKYYVRAYLALANDTIYSNTATVTTKTILTLFDKQYTFDQNSPTILDVVGSEQEGFTICSSMIYPRDYGYFLRLMKVDAGGNLLWKRDYDDGTSKEPLIIKKLPDGYLVGSTHWIDNEGTRFSLRKNDSQESAWSGLGLPGL